MHSDHSGKRLDSWKEIALYLGKNVRTVVRWEKERGLPIRRLPGGKRQPVFAFTAEIDAWISRQQGLPEEDDAPSAAHAASAVDTVTYPEAASRTLVAARQASRVLLGSALLALSALFLLFLTRGGSTSLSTTPDSSVAQELRLSTKSHELRFVRAEVESGIKPYFAVAADFNGDGNLDVAFTTAPAGVIGVLLGKGDGSFFPARFLEGCPHSANLLVADFNRDGHPDIAATCMEGDTVLILWGKGDGTFPRQTTIPVPGGPRYLAAGDLDHDGWTDLVVSSFSGPAIYALRNDSGSFSAALLSRFESVGALAVADFDGDGRSEVVASVRDHGRYCLALFKARSGGSLRLDRLLPESPLDQSLNVRIQAADVDGDGVLDLIGSQFTGSLWIRKGQGHGEFLEPRALVQPGKSSLWRQFVLADLDLDGHPDLLVTDLENRTLLFFTGSGHGEFTLSSTAEFGAFAYSPIVADFNNDHLPDIFVNAYFEGAALFKSVAEKNVGLRNQPPTGGPASFRD